MNIDINIDWVTLKWIFINILLFLIFVKIEMLPSKKHGDENEEEEYNEQYEKEEQKEIIK
jgi:flagellar biosynthesis/type III secretory pathway M-ring protein FliF/YscJ